MSNKVLIFTSNPNCIRQKYVWDFIFSKFLNLESYSFCNNDIFFKNYNGIKITYGHGHDFSEEDIFIPQSNFLDEPNIFFSVLKLQDKLTADAKDYQALFVEPSLKKNTLNFDIIAAIFFLLTHLLSAMEVVPRQNIRKYLKMTQTPIINQWVLALRDILQQKYCVGNILIQPTTFTEIHFEITRFFKYKYLGLFQSLLENLENLFLFQLGTLWSRYKAVFGWQKDPYELLLEKIIEISATNNIKLYFYFVLGDSNILNTCLQQKAYYHKIKDIADDYPTGLVISSNALKDNLVLEKEIGCYENITHKKLTHFSFSSKDKYTQSINSLYGNKFYDNMKITGLDTLPQGFSFGTDKSFFLYDLKKNNIRTIEIIPNIFVLKENRSLQFNPALVLLLRTIFETPTKLSLYFNTKSIIKNYFFADLNKILQSKELIN